jgi:hypothetical protein
VEFGWHESLEMLAQLVTSKMPGEEEIEVGQPWKNSGAAVNAV